MAADGSVYSTSDLGTVPHHHPSLDDLIQYYAYYGHPLTYLGWTEDIEGVAVVSGGSIGFDSITTEPAPAPQEDTLSQAEVDQLYQAISVQNKQFHEATRAAIIDELKPWIQGSGNQTGDRVINDTRAQIAAVPNAVLNARFTLADGTVTNLSGILAAIDAKPVATGTDPDAVVAAIKAQWNK